MNWVSIHGWSFYTFLELKSKLNSKTHEFQYTDTLCLDIRQLSLTIAYSFLLPLKISIAANTVTRRVIWALDEVCITCHNARLLMLLWHILAQTVLYSLSLDTLASKALGRDRFSLIVFGFCVLFRRKYTVGLPPTCYNTLSYPYRRLIMSRINIAFKIINLSCQAPNVGNSWYCVLDII